jgi:hypothetical protein
MTTAACRRPDLGHDFETVAARRSISIACIGAPPRPSKHLFNPKQTVRGGCTTCKVDSFPADRFISVQPSPLSPVSSARTRGIAAYYISLSF